MFSILLLIQKLTIGLKLDFVCLTKDSDEQNKFVWPMYE